MREELLEKCERFLRNTEAIKATLRWSNTTAAMCGAASIAMEEIDVDIFRLKQMSSLFSVMAHSHSVSFSSSFLKPIICSELYIAYNPDDMSRRITNVCQMVHSAFWGVSCQVQSAAIIAQAAHPEHYKWLVDRAKAIYERQKAFHPFITNQDDIMYCCMLALSNKSDDEIIDDVNISIKKLRSMSFSSNVLQAIGFVLALLTGQIEYRAERLAALYKELKRLKCKFSTEYELASLAALSASQKPIDEIAIDVVDADNWLSKQNLFRFFSTVSKKQRRLIAAMLAFDTSIPNTALKACNTPESFFVKQACICSCLSSLLTRSDC